MIFEAMQKARRLFGVEPPKAEKPKPAPELVVIPWWITKGYPDLASAIAVELEKVRAIESPIVLPMGQPDSQGRTWPYDIRADAMDLLESMEGP